MRDLGPALAPMNAVNTAMPLDAMHTRIVLADAGIRLGRISEARGYLDPYQAPPVSSAVPPGYTLVYDEDFTGHASADDIVEDGQAPPQGKPFADSFVTFGVRYLSGNNDRCYKGLASDTGAGEGQSRT